MPDGSRVGGPIGPSQFGVERFTIPDVLDLRAEQIGDRTMMTIAGTPVTFAQMRDRQLHHRLDAETEGSLDRRMHFPVQWDPYFADMMTLADVYHYGTQHYDFHRAQLTLEPPPV